MKIFKPSTAVVVGVPRVVVVGVPRVVVTRDRWWRSF